VLLGRKGLTDCCTGGAAVNDCIGGNSEELGTDCEGVGSALIDCTGGSSVGSVLVTEAGPLEDSGTLAEPEFKTDGAWLLNSVLPDDPVAKGVAGVLSLEDKAGEIVVTNGVTPVDGVEFATFESDWVEELWVSRVHVLDETEDVADVALEGPTVTTENEGGLPEPISETSVTMMGLDVCDLEEPGTQTVKTCGVIDTTGPEPVLLASGRIAESVIVVAGATVVRACNEEAVGEVGRNVVYVKTVGTAPYTAGTV